MASFNRVVLIGNLTRDPEVRYTTGGTAVTDVSLAINRYRTDKTTNQRIEETTFVEVTLWGRTAEIAGEYLGKGRPVLIEGRLQQDQWEDKETGQKRTKLKVVGENMQLLGSRNEGGGTSQPKSSTQTAPAYSSPAQSSPEQSFYDTPAGDGGDVPF
ncbi:MAG: single-stranded DNA-binding protein [Fuerstiella sp.]|nr:single-stranded DNA-binding protein [Fuerstiella sp.]